MTPEELEKFIHRQLRGLPAHQAPGSLEARVLAAIERRAAIPWYHQSWSYWPAAVRMAFVLLALSVTGAVMVAFHSGFNEVSTSGVMTQAGERLGMFSKIYHVAMWMADLGGQLVASIPTVWLYGGGAVIAVFYATVFGLGAAAYRVLYRNH